MPHSAFVCVCVCVRVGVQSAFGNEGRAVSITCFARTAVALQLQLRSLLGRQQQLRVAGEELGLSRTGVWFRIMVQVFGSGSEELGLSGRSQSTHH